MRDRLIFTLKNKNAYKYIILSFYARHNCLAKLIK